jgi:hypothetical protein
MSKSQEEEANGPKAQKAGFAYTSKLTSVEIIIRLSTPAFRDACAGRTDWLLHWNKKLKRFKPVDLDVIMMCMVIRRLREVSAATIGRAGWLNGCIPKPQAEVKIKVGSIPPRQARPTGQGELFKA